MTFISLEFISLHSSIFGFCMCRAENIFPSFVSSFPFSFHISYGIIFFSSLLSRPLLFVDLRVWQFLFVWGKSLHFESFGAIAPIVNGKNSNPIGVFWKVFTSLESCRLLFCAAAFSISKRNHNENDNSETRKLSLSHNKHLFLQLREWKFSAS